VDLKTRKDGDAVFILLSISLPIRVHVARSVNEVVENGRCEQEMTYETKGTKSVHERFRRKGVESFAVTCDFYASKSCPNSHFHRTNTARRPWRPGVHSMLHSSFSPTAPFADITSSLRVPLFFNGNTLVHMFHHLTPFFRPCRQ